MPFDPKSAKKAGKKSKRGPAKKEGPSIKEKMEMLVFKELNLFIFEKTTDCTQFYIHSY